VVTQPKDVCLHKSASNGSEKQACSAPQGAHHLQDWWW